MLLFRNLKERAGLKTEDNPGQDNGQDLVIATWNVRSIYTDREQLQRELMRYKRRPRLRRLDDVEERWRTKAVDSNEWQRILEED
jgi:hypothetical protein